MHEQLHQLFLADQADRMPDVHPDLAARDRARRLRLEQLIADGALHDHHDFLHAAFLLQHGDTLDSYWRAHQYAARAVELGGEETARWLTAATYDRWLMHQGKPQKYGTQYRVEGGQWRLWPVDPATTDAERGQWCVPPLAEALAAAEQKNRDDPPGHRGTGHPAERFGDVTQAMQALLAQGREVARLSVPNLHVIMSEIDGGVDQQEPAPEPLEAAAEVSEQPRGLAPEWTICRYGPGYGALQPDGQVACFWWTLTLATDDLFVIGWLRSWGVPPPLQTVSVGTQLGVWLELPVGYPGMLVVPRREHRCWIVGGSREQAELQQIAATLPL